MVSGESVGVLFGRERYGLENHEVALADAIVTLPVDPALPPQSGAGRPDRCLRMAQVRERRCTAVRHATEIGAGNSRAAARLLRNLERELEKVEYFRPPDKRDTMLINLRNIFHRMQATRQDIQTLQGVIMAIAEGRKGPAKGGVLDGEEAEMLRTLLAEHSEGRVPNERAPVRGLARLLRRNPTDAERRLWDALTKDRRFAGRGFKRQTPIGRHIADLVSFPLRSWLTWCPTRKARRRARRGGTQRVARRARLGVVSVAADEVTARRFRCARPSRCKDCGSDAGS